MFGKKCTLCGGKLDGNNVCTECGLDNSKSEKNYKINTASCDREPLTHVHEENEKKNYSKFPETATGIYNRTYTENSECRLPSIHSDL